jgi:hypothetical protein
LIDFILGPGVLSVEDSLTGDSFIADDAQCLWVQGTRAKELVVDVQERFIKVATKTGQVILEGKLEEKVRC